MVCFLIRTILLSYHISFFLLLFILNGCSTNIELNSKFCQGDGLWISRQNDLEERNLKGEQVFRDKDYFVFAGVGVKELAYEEILEDLEIECGEIKTIRVTTYSTWFESILSFIPLFRFRSILVSGSYLKKDDANLVNSITKERGEESESDKDSNSINEIPDAILDGSNAAEEEYTEDDFEE